MRRIPALGAFVKYVFEKAGGQSGIRTPRACGAHTQFCGFDGDVVHLATIKRDGL